MSDYWVTVCEKCWKASCWHCEDVCQGSDGAGTVRMTASQLDKLGYEHADNYSREKLMKVCGVVEEVITPPDPAKCSQNPDFDVDPVVAEPQTLRGA